MIHKALIRQNRGKIRSVSWDQYGTNASQRAHDRHKVNEALLAPSFFPKGNVQYAEKHQTAQMKRQCRRIQIHATLRALYHIAQDFAAFAAKADAAHHIPGHFQRYLLADTENEHPRHKSSAQSYPYKMFR